MATVTVEVEFTLQHTMEQLREAFVKRGHIPEWHALDTATHGGLFFEKRVVSVPLLGEEDRYRWFVFSLEACGELRRRIVIPQVVPADTDLDAMGLEAFLEFCRQALTAAPGSQSPRDTGTWPGSA